MPYRFSVSGAGAGEGQTTARQRYTSIWFVAYTNMRGTLYGRLGTSKRIVFDKFVLQVKLLFFVQDLGLFCGFRCNRYVYIVVVWNAPSST